MVNSTPLVSVGTLTQLCVCKLYKSPVGSEGVKEGAEKAQRGGEKKGLCERGNMRVPKKSESSWRSYVNQGKIENVRFWMTVKVTELLCLM